MKIYENLIESGRNPAKTIPNMKKIAIMASGRLFTDTYQILYLVKFLVANAFYIL